MSKSDKLLKRLFSNPKDFSWTELINLLGNFGFIELNSRKGSRRKFVDERKNIIILHEPHPGKIVKQYALKQIIARLKELGYLQDE